jgi:hypothetical protein
MIDLGWGEFREPGESELLGLRIIVSRWVSIRAALDAGPCGKWRLVLTRAEGKGITHFTMEEILLLPILDYGYFNTARDRRYAALAFVSDRVTHSYYVSLEYNALTYARLYLNDKEFLEPDGPKKWRALKKHLGLTSPKSHG